MEELVSVPGQSHEGVVRSGRMMQTCDGIYVGRFTWRHQEHVLRGSTLLGDIANGKNVHWARIRLARGIHHVGDRMYSDGSGYLCWCCGRGVSSDHLVSCPHCGSS